MDKDITIRLTEQKTEILKLLAAGEEDKNIGDTLGISTATVRNACMSLLDIFHAKNRPNLIYKACKSQII